MYSLYLIPILIPILRTYTISTIADDILLRTFKHRHLGGQEAKAAGDPGPFCFEEDQWPQKGAKIWWDSRAKKRPLLPSDWWILWNITRLVFLQLGDDGSCQKHDLKNKKLQAINQMNSLLVANILKHRKAGSHDETRWGVKLSESENPWHSMPSGCLA